MMKLIKNILNHVYFASKITSVGNKKLILLTVIVLSQVTAFTDVALIVIFAAIITGTYDQGIVAPVVECFFRIYIFTSNSYNCKISFYLYSKHDHEKVRNESNS